MTENEPRVVHCKRAPVGSFVYVGRPSPFGNPFGMRGESDRARVIEMFRTYFLKRVDDDPRFRDEVLKLKGKDLGCWCSPSPCHADVILEWVNEHA